MKKFLLGLLLGISLLLPEYFIKCYQVGYWSEQYKNAIVMWQKDRDAWSEGKPFECHYGPHGLRW